MRSAATKQLTASNGKSKGDAPVTAPRTMMGRMASLGRLAVSAGKDMGSGLLQDLSKLGSAAGSGQGLIAPRGGGNSGGDSIGPQHQAGASTTKSSWSVKTLGPG